MAGKGRRTGIEMRAVAWAARHPATVGAPVTVAASVAQFGPVTTGGVAAGLVAGGLGWARAHPESFERYGAAHLRAACRRWSCYVGPRWSAVAQACELVRDDRRTGVMLTPRVVRVKSPTPTIDQVTVKLLRGQSLRTWQDRQDELAAALNATALGITRIKPQVLVLTVVRADPFDEAVAATPIPDECADVDLRGIELGESEYAQPWEEPLLGQSWLVSGASGTGKSGLLWNPLRAVGPMVRDGLVRVWMVDPKGGMETLRARELFHRWADHVEDTDEDEDKGLAYRGEAAMDVVEAFRDDMKTTQLDVGGRGKRKFTVSRETPLNVLMIDELAMLTALSSGATTRRLNQLLAEIMTQGRSTGYSVLAYLQEPTKDIVPIRDLFTRRISLRTTSASYVDMVLGDGARMRGALADEIRVGEEFAGIGFRVDDRSRNPIRVRAGLVTDGEIDELVRTCTPHVDPGEATVVAFPRAS